MRPSIFHPRSSLKLYGAKLKAVQIKAHCNQHYVGQTWVRIASSVQAWQDAH